MSTPAGGVRGPVVVVTSFDALPTAAQLKGKVAMFDTVLVGETGHDVVRHRKALNH